MRRIGFVSAVPVTRPMPNKAPTARCVVEAGGPIMLAAIASVAVTTLAVRP